LDKPVNKGRDIDYRLTLVVLVVCAGILAIARMISGANPHVFTQTTFLPIHTIAEFFSIIISIGIFLVSWNTRKEIYSSYSLVLGNAFLCVGLIDLFHALSYAGMPPFIVESSANSATQYWVIARIVGAVALLAAAIARPQPEPSKWRHHIGAAAAVTGAIVVLLVVTWSPEWLPVMYDEEARRLTSLKINLEYAVVGLFIAAMAALFTRRQNDLSTREMLLPGLVIFIFSELCFTLYGSVYDFYNFLGHVFKVAGSYFIYRAIFVAEVQQPYRLLDVERETARRLQEALLPVIPDKVIGVDMGHAYKPAIEHARVGGDFFDVFFLGEHRLGIIIADVAGKGLDAAVQTSMVKYTLRSYAKEHHEPDDVVFKLNNMVYQEELSDHFVTLFYGILDLDMFELTYVNAGHEPQLVLRRRGSSDWLNSTGTVIGGIPDSSFNHACIRLEPGDELWLFTDGLTEARHNSRFLGPKDLERLMRSVGGITAQEKVDSLLGLLQGTKRDEGYELTDDATVLMLRLCPATIE
jgi:phosphoserine phosphatase RsbU/P